MTNFSKMAYQSADDLMFGRAKVPVTCGYGLEVGTGMVLPEVNFTLPTMKVEHEQLPAILRQYDDMVSCILQRLVTLGMPGAMIEFEHAPQMTEELEIGTAITAKIRTLMQSFYEKHGLRTALRVTVCDIREKSRPPQMRSGEATEKMFEAFRLSAANGAHLLSIESTGGKEVSDRALMEADVQGLLLALGILAPRDSRFLWQKIVAIANEHKIIPAGDTACAFANTAMILADQRYIPNVLAAVVRAMSAVRTLVGNEVGAVGPTKDCGYEGPVIKAITGCPVSLEGKSAACAHFSHMGNIAMATCDLWSNESVQNVKLLSGHAPEVFTEILTYDCRLMNEALQAGQERALQNLFVSSDAYKSVHALVISPQASFEIAEAILSHQSDFDRTRAAGLQACQIIRDASATGKLPLPDRESAWLDQIEEVLQENADEGKVLEDGSAQFGELFLPKEYGL